MPRVAIPVLLVVLALQDAVVRNLTPSFPALASVLQSIHEIALLAAGVRVLLLVAGRRMDWFRMVDWVWPLVFVVAGVLSSVTHWVGVKPALLGLVLASKFFGFLALVLSVPWEEKDGERLIRGVAWAVPVLLVTGLIGYLMADFTARHFLATEGDTEYTRGGVTPFMVPFINPTLYGWAMAVGTLAWFALFIERRSRLGLVGVLGGAVGVVLSLKRRPLIGIPLAVLSGVVALSGRQRRRLLVAAAVLMAVGVWFGAGLIRVTIDDLVRNYFDPVAREQTARGATIAVSILLAQRAFPLGQGFGSFGGYAAQYYYSGVYDEFGMSHIYGLSPDAPYYLTDTYWPHILGEAGVIGTLAMLCSLYYLWKKSRQIYQDRSQSDSIRLTALFGSLVLVEAIAESLGGPVFEFGLQALMITLPIGMALRLSRGAPLRPRNPEAESVAQQPT